MRSKSLPGFRILDRFILGEMAGPFIFGILIFTLIFVAGDLLFQAAKLIIEKGVAPGVVVRLFIYRLPEVVALTFPMSCLLATLLGMTRLASNSELVALKSLGVSFYRILRPVIFASFLIASGALAFNETVVPFTSRAAENLMKYEIMKNQASALQKKVFLRDESGGELRRVLYMDQLDPKKGFMENIIVYEFEDGRVVRTSLAKTGVWKDGEWWIEDGQVFEVTSKGNVQLLFRFDRQKLALNVSPEQLERSSRRPVDMSARELWDYIKQAQMAGSSLAQLWVLFHLKLAVPWACVVMAILGASFGATRQARSGSSVGFGISIAIVFAYYVVMSLCRALGETENLPPLAAAWIPNLLFLSLSFFFARKVD